jgi:hypothetical protein
VGFDFLQAKDVGLVGLDPMFEGGRARPYAVDVPGYDLHS